jgi:YD repeat-containing protein
MTLPPLLLALAVAAPNFLPRDPALRECWTDLEAADDLDLTRTFRSDPGPAGAFGPSFAAAFEATLRLDGPGRLAVAIVDRGPCGQSGLAQPFASPEALSGAWQEADALLRAAGEAGPLAREVAATAARLAADPGARLDAWRRERAGHAVAALERDARGLSAPGCRVDHALVLSAGFVRIQDGTRVGLHDADGRLLLVADWRGAALRVVRDGEGRATRLEGRKGAIELDWEGDRVVRARTGAGAEARYEYEAGRLVRAVTPRGETRIAWHPGTERVAGVQAPGGRWTVEYDAAGRPARLEEPGDLPYVESYSYAQSPGSRAREVHVRRTLGERDPEERTVVIVERFDPERGRVLVEETDAEGADVTETRLDAESARVLEIDRGSEVVQLRWDERGRLLERGDADGRTELSYAAVGKVARVVRTSPGGTARTVSYRYDGQGQLLEAQASDGRAATIAYDARGNIATLTVPSGEGEATTLRFSYENDRVVRIEGDDGGTIDVRYGADGEIEKVDSGGRALALRVTSAFQAMLDLTREATVSTGL